MVMIVVCMCRADYTPGALPYIFGTAPCSECSNQQSCVDNLCTGGESDVHYVAMENIIVMDCIIKYFKKEKLYNSELTI